MAYPIISGPYGLLPANEIGGLPYAGSTRMIPIASGYASNINFGDVVQINTTDGTLIKTAMAVGASTQAAVAGTIGVFLGCEYSSATGPIFGKNRYQNWVGGTSAADCVAYVVDDPRVVFKVCAVANLGAGTNSTTQAAFGQAFVGSNVQLNPNYSSTVPLNGDSTAGVCCDSAGAKITGNAPFRVIQLVPDTAVTVSQTANTATSTAMTLTAANSQILSGMTVIGSGIPVGAYVKSVSGTSVTLSAAATSSLTGATFTFTGSPEVLVTWNQGFHSYTNATGV